MNAPVCSAVGPFSSDSSERLEVDLSAEREAVLGPTRSAGVAIEHGALEIERVPEIAGQVPAETGRDRPGCSAGTRSSEVEREGEIVDLQLLIAQRDLKGAPSPRAEIEVPSRSNPAAAVGRVLTGQDPGARNLPRVMVDLSAGVAAPDGCPCVHGFGPPAEGFMEKPDARRVAGANAVGNRRGRSGDGIGKVRRPQRL